MRIQYTYVIAAFLFAFLWTGTQTSYSQQEPVYTQYMYNSSLFNPAYSGSAGHMTIFGQYRTQWVGLTGAPQTANISIDSPIGDSGLGIGVNYTNDRIGAVDANNFSVNLSYTIDVNYTYKLAFGLKGSANLKSFDPQKLDWYEPNDPYSENSFDNKFNANIGAGLFLYSDKTYIGFSIPYFLENDYTASKEGIAVMKTRMHYYLTAGHVINLNQDFLFKPAVLLKAVDGAPLQVDLSANFMYKEKVTLGLAYRWDASVSAIAGFQVSDNIFLGYSYDFDTTNLSHYNSGSHEFFLKFDLFNRVSKVKSARFF